jgi:ABC-type multidrug transport system ATPase subunit
MVDVRDAERRFGDVTVFRRVTFAVTAGRCGAIVGANGTGKSTLLRCISGADHLDSGTITIGGCAVDETSPTFRATVASVGGEVATFAHLTALEHLQLVATAHGLDEPYAAAVRVLDSVGLTPAANHLPVNLSSGQRRRLALASAFVRPRRVLVLDEPEQHLDRDGRVWLAAAIEREKQEGVAVILVSHDPDLVAAVSDQIVDGDAWR